MITRASIITLIISGYVLAENTTTRPRIFPSPSVNSSIADTYFGPHFKHEINNNSSNKTIDDDEKRSSKTSCYPNITSRYVTDIQTKISLQLPVNESSLQFSHSYEDSPVVSFDSNNSRHLPQTPFGEQLENIQKGYIEFDVYDDTSQGKLKNENNLSKISPSLNQTLVRFLPQSLVDAFNSSYFAKQQVTISSKIKPKQNTEEANIILPNLVPTNSKKPSYESEPSVSQHTSFIISATTPYSVDKNPKAQKVEFKNKTINTAIQEIKQLQDEDVNSTSILSVEINSQKAQSTFQDIYQNKSRFKYDDINLSEDNVISPSNKVSKNIFYLSPIDMNVQTKDDRRDYNYNQQGFKKEINVHIVHENLGSYDQKIHKNSSSATKQLDDYQEEVEKQFNHNDFRTNSEAASRKFLKEFKESYIPKKIDGTENLLISHSESVRPESLLHTYIFSSQPKKESNLEIQINKIPSTNYSDVNDQFHTAPFYPGSKLHTYIFSTLDDNKSHNFDYNNSNIVPSEDKVLLSNENEEDSQAPENQESKKKTFFINNIILPNQGRKMFVTQRPSYISSNHKYTFSNHHTENNPKTLVEIQRSVNNYNKFIKEENGNLVEQHEIYTGPEKIDENLLSLERSTHVSLLKNPIRVAHNDGFSHHSGITENDNLHFQQQEQFKQQQEQSEQKYHDQHQIHQTTQEDIMQPFSHSSNVEPYTIIEKYIDRPVPVERIVEKQVRVPYPVTEVVEKFIQQPVPVEKIIDRPIHIPYPVQVDHFIDRPYAVQVPVGVAIPIPVHRYIDRPYAVEKIIEKPIHIPYPVEKVVEKIVEKHVPVEVERVVEKLVPKKSGTSQLNAKDKKILSNIPLPLALVITSADDLKTQPNLYKTTSGLENFEELVPPSVSKLDGEQSYKTLPENIDILLLDDYFGPVPYENQYVHWGAQVKRGTNNHYIKRSPELARSLRVEYGFKPPLVPSLEIDDHGKPLENKRN